MAGVHFQGRLKLVDEHALTSTKLVDIRVDAAIHITAIAQLTAAMNALEGFADALDTIIDPMITDVSLNVPVAVAGLKVAAGDQGCAEGANLVLATVDDNGAHERPYWLPGAVAGVFLPNFRTVDTADPDLLTWLATFDPENGVEICISDDEEVTGIVSGSYATRRRDTTS